MADQGTPPQPPAQPPQQPPAQPPQQPPAQPPPAAAAPPPAGGRAPDGKASGGRRALAVLAALVLALVAAFMVALTLEINNSPPCNDLAAVAESVAEGELECYDGSSGQQTVSQIVGWLSAAALAAAVLAALAFAIRGLGGRIVWQLAAVGVGLGILSFAIAAI